MYNIIITINLKNNYKIKLIKKINKLKFVCKVDFY
jgi:hypothetical protein